ERLCLTVSLCEVPRRLRGSGMTRVFLLFKSGYLLFDVALAMQAEKPAYRRIVLKLSGEAVQERGGRDNISPTVVREIAERIKEVRDLGVQVSVVIGGGNIWRDISASHRGMGRT